MRKKRCLVRLAKLLALLLPIAACVLFMQHYLFYYSSHDSERIEDFYKEEPHSLDVVLIGASEVYAGFSPVYAYEQYGLTSYPFSYPSNPGSLYLLQLKEVLKQQSPQMVLIEIQGFMGDDARQAPEADLRRFVENVPLSRNTVEAVLTSSYDDKLSFLVPFFKYHGEWQMSLDEMEQQVLYRLNERKTPNLLKGEATHSHVDATATNEDWFDDYTPEELDALNHASLIQLLEYCKAEQLDNIVFARFPHKLVSDNQYQRFRRGNRAVEIIESYGYPVIDLEHASDDVSFDLLWDFYNREHLNQYGRQKLTDYVCDWLMTEYSLEPRTQTETARAQWDASIPYLYAFYEADTERMDVGLNEDLHENPVLLQELEARIRAWDE